MLSEYKGIKPGRACEEYANGVKRAAGWAFCSLFNHYFGEGSVILECEPTNEKSIRFFVTEKWLEVNHAGQFGFSTDLAAEFMQHVKQCHLPGCSEARKRLAAIHPFFQKGKLPGGEAIALVSACEGKRLSDAVTLIRKNGFGKTIDEIMPFIEWFLKEPDFWVWPDKESPGLIDTE